MGHPRKTRWDDVKEDMRRLDLPHERMHRSRTSGGKTKEAIR